MHKTSTSKQVKSESTISKCFITGLVCTVLTFAVTTKINNYYDNLNYINFKNQQDSLNLVVESLRNQGKIIITKIDSRLDTIEKINSKYETDINVLLHEPIDSQCGFFSKYILSQSGRFANSNNPNSVEAN